MPIYMGFFDQPNVLNKTLRGDVTAKGFEGWIELQSAQIGQNRSVMNPTGSGTGRVTGRPAPTEITITKSQDAASTTLFRESMQGKGKLVVIAFVKDGTTYLTIVLRDTLISNYSLSGHGGMPDARPTESLTLNFTGITYNVQDKSPEVSTWPLRQASEPGASWGP